jgi:hypothetical protein
MQPAVQEAVRVLWAGRVAGVPSNAETAWLAKDRQANHLTVTRRRQGIGYTAACV